MRSDLEAAMQRALAEGTPDAAWAHLEPLRASLDDRDVAGAWIALLQASPSRPSAADDALAILARFGATDHALAAAAITALVRIDERRGPDEPRPAGSPAEVAEREAARLLASLDADDPDRDALRVARANALRRLGRDAECIAELERAIERDARGEWLADLGLAHKHAGRFGEAALAFARARAALGDTRRILFDVAIAALGAGDHDGAAAALRALGLPIERSDNGPPFVPDLLPLQVRIPTRGPGHAILAVVPDEAITLERVWAQPLSPFHGVLRTPTFRDAVADWGDVVLWDAAPVARFAHEGRSVPVMPLLALLSAGRERRFRFLAMEQHAGQVSRLASHLPAGVVLYEHGTRVESLCARCAAGDVLVKHEHEPPTEHRAVIGKLLVPPEIDLVLLERELERALATERGVLLAVPSLYEALRLTPKAGKHHKTWGAIERGVARRGA